MKHICSDCKKWVPPQYAGSHRTFHAQGGSKTRFQRLIRHLVASGKDFHLEF